MPIIDTRVLEEGIRTPTGKETRTDLAPKVEVSEDELAKQQCLANGGTWDIATKTCQIKQKTPEELRAERIKETGKTGAELEAQGIKLTTPEVLRDQDTGDITGITKTDNSTFFGDEGEAQAIARNELLPRAAPLGTAEAGTAATRQQQLLQGQQLASQVGQFGQAGGLTPTGLDYSEAAIQGAVGSIPSALRTGGIVFAGALAGAGAGALAGTAVTPVIGTAIGAGIGLIAGVVAGMTSNFKSQRTDTTNAQQRVLDEGKQTLMDWATLAKADPTNRNFYLSQFNLQLQQIQTAHNQMLTDTKADVVKFETALPNLAEFNTFYSVGGERDALINEMNIALQTPVATEYQMIELGTRRLEQ